MSQRRRGHLSGIPAAGGRPAGMLTHPHWGDLLAQWVSWMRAAGAPETTIALRRYYLTRLAGTHPGLLGLTAGTLTAWMATAGWAPNTRKSARSALRCFYGWAVLAGLLEVSPAESLPVVRVPRAKAKPTPEASYRAALVAADDRARLIIMLAGRCGLRRGEVARVRREDVEPDLTGWSLRVVGKGGHVRVVPLPDDLAEQLLASGPGWVFPSPRGGHLTPHHVAKLARTYLPAGMHTLRHRCASTAYAATRDLRAVQELLGHTRPETTAGYVRLPDDAVRAAMRAAAA